jgi:hypothetical protein
VTAVVETVAASSMMMVEGGSGGNVEQWWLWQWMATLTADAPIDGGGVVGCSCRRQTAMVMATEGDSDT